MTTITKEQLIDMLDKEFGIKGKKYKKMEISELTKIYQAAYKERSKKIAEEDEAATVSGDSHEKPEGFKINQGKKREDVRNTEPEKSEDEGVVEDKDNSDVDAEESGVSESEETAAVEQADALPTVAELEAFQSYCTYEFDPTPNCYCLKTCRLELPNEFQRCSDHHALVLKVKGVKKQKAKGVSTGKRGGGRVAFQDSTLSRVSLFNHNVKSQAALIDHLLEDGIGFTAEGLAELLETKTTRIMAHIQHVKKEHGGTFTKINGYYYLSDRVPPTDRLCHEVKKQKA